MQLSIIIFLACFIYAVLIIFSISNYLLVPLPFFNHKQKEFGEVIEITFLEDLRIYKVEIRHDMKISNKSDISNDGFQMTSASISGFVHFKEKQLLEKQVLPKVGDLIEADVIFYYFSLRNFIGEKNTGFSFVKSWKIIKEIPDENRIEMIIKEVF